MTQRAVVEEIESSSTGFWRSLFSGSLFGERTVATALTDPLRCDAPVLRDAEIAAIYSGQRVAGDFYEFLRVSPSRMLFLLLDIAGVRADTREILVAVQKKFRSLAPRLLAGGDFNETTAMIELCYAMNLTILHSGVRSCPAFIGCYNEDLGTVCYANAGHPPGLLRDDEGVTLLEATGLPLGLFSHTTQSAATCHLMPGSALMVVSRGIIEADYEAHHTAADSANAGAEFGVNGASQSLRDATSINARDLCLTMLRAARKFSPMTPANNDLTTLALVRNACSADLKPGSTAERLQ